jgi:uncharacterized protein YnzC (UPF0291/DUF896 family)
MTKPRTVYPFTIEHLTPEARAQILAMRNNEPLLTIAEAEKQHVAYNRYLQEIKDDSKETGA